VTIDISVEHEIRRLHDVEKWKRGTIVAELGVHADVVDRVLDRGADHALLVAPRPSLVDPYAAFIDETLRVQIHHSCAVHAKARRVTLAA